MTIRFVHDQFRWEPATRRFLLVEPPSLFDEPPDRLLVQAWRHQHGWEHLYTHQFNDGDQLGVIDLWSNSRPEEVQSDQSLDSLHEG